MAEIKQQDFNGFPGAVVIATPKVQMAIRTDVGPRIAHFGATDGNNLLLSDGVERKYEEWQLREGHRVWVTRPGADESPDAYRPDNLPCEVEIGEHSVTVTSPADPFLHVRKGIEVMALDDGLFSVRNFAKNMGPMLYSGGIWALTCTRPAPGTSYSIPLGDGSEWDCFNYKIFRAWAGHTSPVNDPQIEFHEDILTIRPQGVETKRMIEAPKGVIAMHSAYGYTFAKKVDFIRGAQYPHGCNIAFYIGPGNFMVEMETMSPEITLRPGETAVNEETWLLHEATGFDAQQLVSLFD